MRADAPEVTAVRSTGIGSWPGTRMADAVQIAFAECPELPYLPEQPARGPHAGLIGRSTALLAGLSVDLQPAGWRLTDGSGRDHRAARSTLRMDLDLLEEHAQDYRGPFKLSVAGPWTLAATVERPRGDRLLADSGARRDLGQSLAEGLADLVAELARRLPELELLVQLDEPLLPAVMTGSVATASGFSRHRVVDLPELSGTLRHVVEQLGGTDGTPVVVHCCAAGFPVDLVRRSGVAGVSLDLDQLVPADWDALGTGLEEGLLLWLGGLPTDAALTADEVARRCLVPLRALGLDPGLLTSQLVLTPACGLAGSTDRAALQALRTVRSAADIVTDQLAD
ncbi:MAG: vitamin-B12 independent methionine synthase family protein [uncultured Friedmanniella sp.]|uniref:Vitamin-B12 independent methionine synthase family protein n=1 Tax=uncultured Friedmanniella sp. TaxID=335381 RepID=A0A6J4L2A6_9ACTN|nr:MAG: vitamin-B12 independent methionine synthase family protein [uncultured Friedmanniella sp.]